jgi:hypothetical protein
MMIPQHISLFLDLIIAIHFVTGINDMKQGKVLRWEAFHFFMYFKSYSLWR